MESIVLFFVLLFLSLLSLAIRWFNEKIKREIALRDLKDLFVEPKDVQVQPEPHEPDITPAQTIHMPGVLPAVALPVRRRTWSRRFAGNRAALRQGIITMTILGPCRAMEPRREDASFPYRP